MKLKDMQIIVREGEFGKAVGDPIAISFAEFVENNKDGVEVSELLAIADALLAGETYRLLGGVGTTFDISAVKP